MTFSGNKLLALENLASGMSHTETAEASGVSRRTIHNWLQIPEFKAAVDEAKAELLRTVFSRLRRVGIEAVESLRQVANSENLTAAASASRTILELSLRYREQEEVDAIIAQLKGEDAQKGIEWVYEPKPVESTEETEEE
jgi:hypothetical protein